MKQQETHLKQQVSYPVCVLSLVILVWFSSLPQRGTTRSSLTWKTQGQDCCWVWYW